MIKNVTRPLPRQVSALQARDRKDCGWLANTGQLCGANVQAGTKPSTGGRYLMPVSNFSELADTVVTCKKSKTEVKPELLDLLRQVMSLKDASVFYRENSSSNEFFERDSEGHLYTIEVLKNVLPRFKTPKRAQPLAKPRELPKRVTTARHDDIRESYPELRIVSLLTGKGSSSIMIRALANQRRAWPEMGSCLLGIPRI